VTHRCTPLDLPDEPRWVEAHGIAADPTSWRTDLRTGYAIGNDAAALAIIAPDTDSGGAIAISREHPAHTILVSTDDLAAALRGTGRTVTRALLHVLADATQLPDLDGACELPADAALAHCPADLAAEIERARPRVWAAYVDGAPVSFAYASWRSARWFDVAVETLPGARQLGLATLVTAAMIRAERAAGREPVWGADEGNHGSLRLAARLGFVVVDELWVATPAP
jgi:hypothetical protein